MKLFVLLPTIASIALAGPTAAGPIRSVTLYETGLAELGFVLPGNDASTLQVDLRDVDDVLKSLILRGEGLEGVRISLPSGDRPASPLDLSGGADAVLEALTGEIVTLPARKLTGTILRVGDSVDCGNDRCGRIVTVMRTSDGALVSVPITDSLEIVPQNRAAADGLARTALRAADVRKGSEQRGIEIETSGAPGEVRASFVISSPVWSTSWRAETGADGNARIEAWAVIRNATSSDWTDVELTLSSGAPRAIAADLYATRWGRRETADPVIGFARGKSQAFMAAADMEMTAMAMPLASLPPAGNEVQEGIDARFSFREPVDLAAGDVLSLPLVTGDFDARSHLVWAGGHDHDLAGHPDRILELTNTLPVRVPAGIMTMRDASSGYVGDSHVPMMAPGEATELIYGQEPMVEVTETVRRDVSGLSLRVSEEGVLVEDLQIVETAYAILAKGAAEHAVTVRHPVVEGWNITIDGATPTPGQLVEGVHGNGAVEKSMELAPGGSATIMVRAENPARRLVPLQEVDGPLLIRWLERPNIEPATAAWLDAALDVRRSQQAIEAERLDLIQERETAANDQARLAGLLAVLDGSTAEHGRFSGDIAAREDRIRTIDALLAEIEPRMAALDQYLAGLSI
ncbi:DUF4139 domain-containing protein [Paracoccus sp. ME4]|uniref:DUF4139 domain-containing protein n=1 Tax=Paracoccus sp. ME4 TaxID=3138066 RepID=UPI00398B56FF